LDGLGLLFISACGSYYGDSIGGGIAVNVCDGYGSYIFALSKKYF
jgi:hypothetical protein